MGADVATSLTIQRPATILSKIGASDLRRFPRRSIRQQKISFAEMRAQGARSLLIYRLPLPPLAGDQRGSMAR